MTFTLKDQSSGPVEWGIEKGSGHGPEKTLLFSINMQFAPFLLSFLSSHEKSVFTSVVGRLWVMGYGFNWLNCIHVLIAVV